MEDTYFKQTEKLLYNYYEDLHRLAVIKISNSNLVEQYEQIEGKLRTNRYTLDTDLESPGFDERVQTSSSGVSRAESNMCKQAERLIEEQKIVHEKLFVNEQKARELRRNTLEIEANLESLNEECKKFVELKYKSKFSATKISYELSMSERNYYEFRKKTIENIARWLQIKGAK